MNENWLHNYNEALTGDIETTDDEDVILTENKQINEETSQNGVRMKQTFVLV